MMKNARGLIENEMFIKMFSEPNLEALDTSLTTPTFSMHDFVSDQLQQIFFPWHLSLLHLLPDWIVLSGLIIIGLVLTKLFLHPALAVCHLVRDSSLTLTEKIISVLIPVSSAAKIRKDQAMGRSGQSTSATLEARVYDLETRLNNFQAQMTRGTVKIKELPV